MKSGIILFFKKNGKPTYTIALKEEYKVILNSLYKTLKPKITDVFVMRGYFASTLSSLRRIEFPTLFANLNPQAFD